MKESTARLRRVWHCTAMRTLPTGLFGYLVAACGECHRVAIRQLRCFLSCRPAEKIEVRGLRSERRGGVACLADTEPVPYTKRSIWNGWTSLTACEIADPRSLTREYGTCDRRCRGSVVPRQGNSLYDANRNCRRQWAGGRRSVSTPACSERNRCRACCPQRIGLRVPAIQWNGVQTRAYRWFRRMPSAS